MILLSRSSGKKTKIKWLGPLTQRFDHKKVNKCKKFHFLTNLKLFWLWFFSQKISNINLLLGKKPKNAKKTCFTLISYNLDEEKSIFQQLVTEDPLFKECSKCALSVRLDYLPYTEEFGVFCLDLFDPSKWTLVNRATAKIWLMSLCIGLISSPYS